MADNILRATIQVTAPGVKETFAQVANSTKVAETSLTQLGTTVTKTEAIVRQLPPAITNTSLTLKDQRSILVALQKQYAALSTQQAKSRFGLELAADIKIANAEIKRLEAGAVSSFGRIGTSATKGFSALRQLAFILPGLGIAGIFNLAFTAIDSVIQSLFSLNRGFKDGEIAAALFRQALDDISDSAAKLKSRLDFQDDISKLRASIAGLKGSDLDILDLGNRTKSAVTFITAEQQITDGLKEQKRQIIEVGKEYIKTGEATSKFLELAALAASGQTVPKTLVGQLTGREKSFAESYIAVLKEIETSTKRSSEAQSTIGENFLKTQEAQQKKQEEILKQRKSDYDKFVSDTIARARELDAAFKGIIDISPNFSVLDTTGEKFKKAFGFLEKFDAGKLKITFSPEFDDKAIRNALDLLGKKFKDVRFDIIPLIQFPIDQKIIPETQAEITRILKEIADIPPATFDEKFDFTLDLAKKVDDLKTKLKELTLAKFGITLDSETLDPALQRVLDIQRAIETTAETLINTLTPAFQSLFSAIVAGGDGFKSFFDSLKEQVQQLIGKLIAAAVAAAILNTLIGKGSIGFLKIFGKLLGFEKGGRPPVGKDVLVGEKRTEIFVPDVGQPVLLGVGGPHLFRADRPGKIIPKVGKEVTSLFGSISKTTGTEKIVVRDISDTSKVKEISQSISRIVTTVLDKVAQFQGTTLDKVASFHSSVSSSFERVIGWATDATNSKQTDSKETVKEVRYIDRVKESSKVSSGLNEIYKLFSGNVSDSKFFQSKTDSTSKELYSVQALKEISSTLSKVFEYSTASTETGNIETTTRTIDKTIHSAFESTYSGIEKLASVYKTDTSKESNVTDQKLNKDVSRETNFSSNAATIFEKFFKEKSSKLTENQVGQTDTKNSSISVLSSLVNNSYEKNVSSAFDHIKEIFSKTSDKTNSSFVRESVTQSAFQSLVTSATSSIKELKELSASYSNASLIQKDSKETSSTHSEHSKVFESVRQFTTKIINIFSSVLERIIDRIKPQPIPAIANNITKILSAASTLNNLTYRAKGGPVSRNAPTIVGEKGWELFTPSVSGHIIPHHKVSSYIKNLVEKNLLSTKEINIFKSTRNLKDLNLSKIFNRRITNISELTHKELSTIIGKQFAGFRAGGGFVGGGSTIAVGERNFELFVPNTGASIITNNNNAGGVGHVAGGTLKVEGNIRIAGSDLIAVISNASRSQSRLS